MTYLCLNKGSLERRVTVRYHLIILMGQVRDGKETVTETRQKMLVVLYQEFGLKISLYSQSNTVKCPFFTPWP